MIQLSEKRLRANRANAARSTGPVTEAGKQRSSLNAMRHGLLAKQILVGKESPENFEALCQMLTARFDPVDDFEFGMIEELAASYWRLRRAWAVETEMLEQSMQTKSSRRQISRMAEAYTDLAADNRLNLLHRYESRLHMMYQRALHNLLLLRQIGGPSVPVCQPVPAIEQHSEPAPEPVSPLHEPAPDPVCKNEPKTPSVSNTSLAPTAPKPQQNASKLDPNSSKTPFLPCAPEPYSPKESEPSPTTPSF